MSLCGEMCFSIQNQEGNLAGKKSWLSVSGFGWKCSGKTLLLTVVWHFCLEMKTRREKVFIWVFQNNKRMGSKNGQRISSVVGCLELFV